jgi:hypothetical protein
MRLRWSWPCWSASAVGLACGAEQTPLFCGGSESSVYNSDRDKAFFSVSVAGGFGQVQHRLDDSLEYLMLRREPDAGGKEWLVFANYCGGSGCSPLF